MSAAQQAGLMVIGPDDIVTVLVTEDGTPAAPVQREYVVGVRAREWADERAVAIHDDRTA